MAEGSLFLFDADEEAPHEIKKEWEGMPEFTSIDLTPVSQIIVSFASHADRVAFGDLVGQKITAKTKSVWYPKVDITRYSDKRYKYEDGETATDTTPE